MAATRKRGKSQYGQLTQVSGSTHHFGGGEPGSHLTRNSRLACIAVKLAVRLDTERVIFFVVDDIRLSEPDIEDASVHR
jgi:hypothetical protein